MNIFFNLIIILIIKIINKYIKNYTINKFKDLINLLIDNNDKYKYARGVTILVILFLGIDKTINFTFSQIIKILSHGDNFDEDNHNYCERNNLVYNMSDKLLKLTQLYINSEKRFNALNKEGNNKNM